MTVPIAVPRQDLKVIGLVGAAHCGSHFFHLVLPPLFPFLQLAFDTSYVQLGLLMTVFFVTSGLAQTPAGFLVDRIGAARVLAGGLGLLGLGALLGAMAPTYALLFPVAALLGLGNSVFHPSDYAILGHHVTVRRMARAFSVHTVGGTLGWALAPLVMAAVGAAAGWRVALLLAGGLGLGLAGLILAHRDALETPGHHAPAAGAATVRPGGRLGVLASPPVLLCFAFFCFQAMGVIALQGFMPLALGKLWGLDLVLATATLTAYMIGSAAGTLAGGLIADRTGSRHGIIAIGLASAAFLVLLIGWVALPMPLLWPVVAVAGALHGGTTPSRDLLVRSSAPPGASGKVFGFVYSGLDLGATIAPAVAGWLLDRGQPRGVFLFVAAVTLLSILAASTVRPAPRPLSRPAEA